MPFWTILDQLQIFGRKDFGAHSQAHFDLTFGPNFRSLVVRFWFELQKGAPKSRDTVFQYLKLTRGNPARPKIWTYLTQIDLFSLGVTRRCRTNTGENLLYSKENAHLSSFELESMPHSSSLSSQQLINLCNSSVFWLSELYSASISRSLSTGQ